MYQYSVILGIGAAIGILWVIRESENPNENVNYLGWVIAWSLVGSRAVYVLMNASYFLPRPLESLMFWMGGMNWIGAFLGCMVGLLSLVILRRKDFWELLDRFLPAAAWIASAVWIASWISGTWYGPELTGFPAMMAKDEWGNLAQRFPLQPLAAFGTLTGFMVLDIYRYRDVFGLPGRFGSLSGVLIFGIVFFASAFRADPVYQISGYTLDTLVAGGITVIFLIALLVRRQKDL